MTSGQFQVQRQLTEALSASLDEAAGRRRALRAVRSAGERITNELLQV